MWWDLIAHLRTRFGLNPVQSHRGISHMKRAVTSQTAALSFRWSKDRCNWFKSSLHWDNSPPEQLLSSLLLRTKGDFHDCLNLKVEKKEWKAIILPNSNPCGEFGEKIMHTDPDLAVSIQRLGNKWISTIHSSIRISVRGLRGRLIQTSNSNWWKSSSLTHGRCNCVLTPVV